MGEPLFIRVCLALLLSLGLNIFVVWYCRNLLRRLIYVSEHMTTLVEEVVIYNDHLNAVHEMETFYGDETLGDLLRHSNGLIETLEDFAEIYTMFDASAEELFEEVNDDDAETSPP